MTALPTAPAEPLTWRIDDVVTDSEDELSDDFEEEQAGELAETQVQLPTTFPSATNTTRRYGADDAEDIELIDEYGDAEFEDDWDEATGGAHSFKLPKFDLSRL